MSVLGRWLGGAPLYRGAEVEVREKDGVRTLHLGSETIQSAMRLDAPNALELAYTRAMMAFLLFASKPQRILMIGLGGGSVSKFMYHRLPQVRQTVIEVSSEVITVARKFFFLPPDDGRLSVELGEGAQYVGRCTSPVDVMLVDVFMPHMRGFESIRMFHERRPDVPVVAMSGYAFANAERAPDFLRMTIELGAACCLRKPFTPDALLTVVNQCITSPEASARLSK